MTSSKHLNVVNREQNLPQCVLFENCYRLLVKMVECVKMALIFSHDHIQVTTKLQNYHHS